MNNEELCRPALFDFLESNGYTDCKILKDGRVACIAKFLFTAAIISGTPEHMEDQWDDRWCFHDVKSARESLKLWDGTGEPAGWHRHIPSGRRRDDGDPLKEYINP